MLTGGRLATWCAAAAGTPCARSPADSVLGSVFASPAIISEKKKPIDSDIPEFWNTDRMPEAAPRYWAGTLLMIEEVLGAANRPEPMPLQKISAANAGYGKFTGSSSRPVNAHAASSSPAVAKIRDPNRSDSVPEIGRR